MCPILWEQNHHPRYTEEDTETARAEAEAAVSHSGLKAGREACALSRQLRLGEHKGAGEPQAQPHCPITQPALRSSQSCPNGPHLVPLAAHFLPARLELYHLAPCSSDRGWGPSSAPPTLFQEPGCAGQRGGSDGRKGAARRPWHLDKSVSPHRPPPPPTWEARGCILAASEPGTLSQPGLKALQSPPARRAMKVRLPPPPAPSTWLLPAGKGCGPHTRQPSYFWVFAPSPCPDHPTTQRSCQTFSVLALFPFSSVAQSCPTL